VVVELPGDPMGAKLFHKKKCKVNSDCASNECRDKGRDKGFCAKQGGEQCHYNSECVSNMCKKLDGTCSAAATSMVFVGDDDFDVPTPVPTPVVTEKEGTDDDDNSGGFHHHHHHHIPTLTPTMIPSALIWPTQSPTPESAYVLPDELTTWPTKHPTVGPTTPTAAPTVPTSSPTTPTPAPTVWPTWHAAPTGPPTEREGAALEVVSMFDVRNAQFGISWPKISDDDHVPQNSVGHTDDGAVDEEPTLESQIVEASDLCLAFLDENCAHVRHELLRCDLAPFDLALLPRHTLTRPLVHSHTLSLFDSHTIALSHTGSSGVRCACILIVSSSKISVVTQTLWQATVPAQE
jgi:hypothetical protein